MKNILITLACLLGLPLLAANPTFSSFVTGQFTNDGIHIGITNVPHANSSASAGVATNALYTGYSDTNSIFVTSFGNDATGVPGSMPYSTLNNIPPNVTEIYLGQGSFSATNNITNSFTFVGMGRSVSTLSNSQQFLATNGTFENLNLLTCFANYSSSNMSSVYVDNCSLGATNVEDIFKGNFTNMIVLNSSMQSVEDVLANFSQPSYVFLQNDTLYQDANWLTNVGFLPNHGLGLANGETLIVDGGNYMTVNGYSKTEPANSGITINAVNGSGASITFRNGPHFWHYGDEKHGLGGVPTPGTLFNFYGSVGGFTNINGACYDNGVPLFITNGVVYPFGITNLPASGDAIRYGGPDTLTNGGLWFYSAKSIPNGMTTNIQFTDTALASTSTNTLYFSGGILTNVTSP